MNPFGTSITGGNLPHNNMPPFLGLTLSLPFKEYSPTKLIGQVDSIDQTKGPGERFPGPGFSESTTSILQKKRSASWASGAHPNK